MIIGQSRSFEWEAALRDPHYTRDILLEYSAAVPGLGEADLAKAETHYRAAVAVAPASAAANDQLAPPDDDLRCRRLTRHDRG